MSGEMPHGAWERFDHDPRLPAHRHLRASDRDRDVVSEVLTEAFAEGRLDRAELDERQDQLRAARTLGELPPLVRDLVSDQVVTRRPSAALRQEAEAQYRQRLVGAFGSFLVPTLICWVIWVSLLVAGTGTGFPWPLFVTIGTAMGPVGVLANGREKQIGQIQRDLEEKEERREARRRRRLQGGG
ncbi:DUF1707 SHOCT-like domain-containing protein [Nocardioides marmoraquaticus]